MSLAFASSRAPFIPRSSCGRHPPRRDRSPPTTDRRSLLLSGSISLALVRPPRAATAAPTATAPAPSPDASELSTLRAAAVDAFARRDFPSALVSIRRVVALRPDDPDWREALGQCLVDGAPPPASPDAPYAASRARDFDAATRAYDDAIRLTDPADVPSVARRLAGRALAREGAGDWTAALRDYDAALETASRGGLPPDPYILNARGNVLAAGLGDFRGARDAYLDAAANFQASKGINTSANNERRADGYAFAASNAALALAQLGDLPAAREELRKVSRRAAGNADARAALAALYWAEGRGEDAEREWEFACDRISVGCAKYRDEEWLANVRRWPPKMVRLLDDFLRVR